MAFADRVAGRHVAFMFYVRISGLPYIFASQAIPTSWDAGSGTTTISGESYTWSPTIVTDDDFATVAQRAEPKAGIGVTGSLSVRFAVTGTAGDATNDVWLDLTNHSTVRSDLESVSLWLDCTVSATSISTGDLNTGWSTTGNIYIGTETIAYGSKGARSFSSLTRGRFGSSAQFHPGISTDTTDTTGLGPIVSSKPLLLEGRIFELWVATGYLEGGVFVPYGSSAMSAEDKKIYSGLVVGAQLNDALTIVEVDTQSLDQVLARDVGSRLPRAKGGNNKRTPWEWIQVDDSCNQVTFSVQSYPFGVSALGAPRKEEIALQRDNGSGVSEDVPDGLYHYGEIGQYLWWTITKSSAWTHFFSGTTFGCRLYNSGDESEPKFSLQLIVASTAVKYTDNTYFKILMPKDRTGSTAPNRTIWGELGFTQTAECVVEELASTTTYNLTANRKASVFRWPANSSARRLYYHDPTGPTFTAAPGWVDDDGNSITGHALVGKDEVVRFSAVDTDEQYLTVAGRNELNTLAEEELYVEYDPQKDRRPDVVQGFVTPATSLARTMLYALLGMAGTALNDATWDEGWWGSGIKVPAAHVDIASFADLDKKRPDQQFRQYAIFKAEPFREIFADDLILSQLFVGMSGGKITLFEVLPPTESSAGSARTLDTSTYTSVGGVGWDANNDKMITRIEFRGGYDQATGKYLRTLTQNNQTAIATYGEQQTLKLDLRGVPNFLATKFPSPKRGLTFGKACAVGGRQIFAAYGWPYVVLEIDVAALEVFDWEIGDTVSITHTALPATTTVGRGWTNVLGRIYAIKYMFKSRRACGRVTVVTRRHDGRRFSTYAPSVYLASKSSDTSWTASANQYTYSGDGVDLDGYAINDYVNVFALEDGTITRAQVTNISGTAVTFASAGVTSNAPCIMMPVDYDDVGATDAQLAHVYMADFGPPGALSSWATGEHVPFRYV